jgi:hypothetical protein
MVQKAKAVQIAQNGALKYCNCKTENELRLNRSRWRS